MPIHSDNTFGAKLQRGKDMATAIQGFDNYMSARAEDSIDGFQSFILEVESISSNHALSEERYKVAVDLRHAAYKVGPSCLEKKLPLIKAAVEGQYGKKSTESTIVNEIITKMRKSKIIRTPISLSSSQSTTELERKISNSAQSYGAQIQYMRDLIDKISLFPAYFAANPDLQIDTLRQFTSQLDNLNTNLMATVQLSKGATIDRKVVFKQLDERKQRIKQNVKSQYGVNSKEYKLIKGL